MLKGIAEAKMIIYKETKEISDAQLRPLYEAVGWSTYTRAFEDLSVLLAACQIVYTAWEGERLVGLIRTVGDGLSIQYVQDLLVLPDFQKMGIGKALLAYVLEKSCQIRQVALATDASEENKRILAWYEKQGLTSYEVAGVAGFWLLRK